MQPPAQTLTSPPAFPPSPQALHIAVMRRRPACVAALLEAGCPAGPRNARGWVPLMEAVELGDKPLALQLARAEVAQVRVVGQAGLGQVGGGAGGWNAGWGDVGWEDVGWGMRGGG